MAIKRGIRGRGLTVRKSWTAGAEDIGSDEYRLMIRKAYCDSDKPPMNPEGVAAFAGAFARHLREQGGDPAEEQSPSWYADEIDAQADAMMTFLDHPDAREPRLAVMYACHLGMLMKEAMLKFKVEEDWQLGCRVRDGSSTGGKKTAERIRPEIEARYRRLAKLVDDAIESNPRLSVNGARENIRKREGVSLSKVARAHRKFGKKADHKPAK